LISPGHRNYNAYDLDLSASYEIDVWGRLRRATEAANAQLLASEEGRRTVVLTLVTSVADAYIQLLALDDELAIAQRTLESRREVLHLQKVRFEAAWRPKATCGRQNRSTRSRRPRFLRCSGRSLNRRT